MVLRRTLVKRSNTPMDGDRIARLVNFFHRNGYVRQQNAEHLSAEYQEGDGD